MTLIWQFTEKLFCTYTAIKRKDSLSIAIVEEVIYREHIVMHTDTYTAQSWECKVSSMRHKRRVHIGSEVRSLHKVGTTHLCRSGEEGK